MRENESRPLVVTRKRVLARDVVEFELTTADGSALTAWAPGAHIDLTVAPGMTRQYSLCGPTDDASRYVIAILREPAGRGGSVAAHDELSEGAMVEVGGPRNHFEIEDAPAYLFVAGGIGVTPIIPMVADAERRGVQWKLLYGGRTLDSMSFLSTLEAYGDRVTIRPQDQYGHLDLASFLAGAEPGTLVYGCGPEPLLGALEAACEAVPAVELRVERFAPAAEIDTSHDQGFEIELAESGITLEVAADESIVTRVRAAGIEVLTSCEEGTCGSCETGVLAGEILHRDFVLSEADRETGETMMICVSRCKGRRLVLEL